MNVQLYLNVPYEQSARAKAMGARWDSQMRFWYVPHGLDINNFAEWWPTHLREQVARLADEPKLRIPHLRNPAKGAGARRRKKRS